MRLKTYLADKKLSPAEFGALVGASARGVQKWIRGERTPRPDAMRKIQEVTDGEVSANDFIEQAAA